MSADCIFCRIVEGKTPSTRVYEDADALAFMDIGPIVRGHTLVIPKSHHDPITEIDDEHLPRIPPGASPQFFQCLSPWEKFRRVRW